MKNLPIIRATEIVEPVFFIAAGKKYSPTHYNSFESTGKRLTTREEKSKNRSKTYLGVAKAIADQWGRFLINKYNKP